MKKKHGKENPIIVFCFVCFRHGQGEKLELRGSGSGRERVNEAEKKDWPACHVHVDCSEWKFPNQTRGLWGVTNVPSFHTLE